MTLSFHTAYFEGEGLLSVDSSAQEDCRTLCAQSCSGSLDQDHLDWLSVHLRNPEQKSRNSSLFPIPNQVATEPLAIFIQVLHALIRVSLVGLVRSLRSAVICDDIIFKVEYYLEHAEMRDGLKMPRH